MLYKCYILLNYAFNIFFPIYCVAILFSGFSSNKYKTIKNTHSKGFIIKYVISASIALLICLDKG